MSRAPLWLPVLGLILVLTAANYTIRQRQHIVERGQAVLLDLRPVDPRSLMQGDYMALRYSDSAFPQTSEKSGLPRRGAFIVELDERNVATFSRADDGRELAANEVRLKYKQVDSSGRIRLGAESFFFEEGQAPQFVNARYGVLHVDAAGNSVLIGLADADGRVISPD